jgi:hypothetical protein
MRMTSVCTCQLSLDSLAYVGSPWPFLILVYPALSWRTVAYSGNLLWASCDLSWPAPWPYLSFRRAFTVLLCLSAELLLCYFVFPQSFYI